MCKSFDAIAPSPNHASSHLKFPFQHTHTHTHCCSYTPRATMLRNGKQTASLGWRAVLVFLVSFNKYLQKTPLVTNTSNKLRNVKQHQHTSESREMACVLWLQTSTWANLLTESMLPREHFAICRMNWLFVFFFLHRADTTLQKRVKCRWLTWPGSDQHAFALHRFHSAA